MAEWWAETERDYARLLPHFARFVKPGSLVFDVGACHGEYTMMFMKLGARHVVAIEPLLAASPADVERLTWRYGADEEVTLIPLALSDKTGSTTMRISRTAGPYLLPSIDPEWITKSAHASFYPDDLSQDVIVPTTTLDTLIEAYGAPDFIKIDVEGAGRMVIRGLHSPVPALNFETHFDWLWDAEESCAHLMTLGDYEFNFCLGTSSHIEFADWCDYRATIDYLAGRLTTTGQTAWSDMYARLKHRGNGHV